MEQKLYVFYKQKPVGVLLKKEDDTLSFTYSNEWLNDPESFYLSPALKLESKEFNHREARSFFENLLPEGEVRKHLEKIFHESLDDDYNFLAKYGLDCAGAFVISPLENYVSSIDEKAQEQIDLEKLKEAHQAGKHIAIHALKEYEGRFSLAGAQDKIPVIYDKNALYIPTGGGPTTHILKPPARVHGAYDTVYNEAFCMDLAREVKLPVPKVYIIGHDEFSYPFYIIERYDRIKKKGATTRLHQFDFCQGHGYPSGYKYEVNRMTKGPSFKDNIDLVREHSANPIRDMELLIDWLLFNLLIGNNDSHSKNISFIKTENGYELSPFYDIMSTAIYKETNRKFAFKIAGQRNFTDIRKKHFILMAQEIELPNENYIWERMLYLINLIDLKIDSLKGVYEEDFGIIRGVSEIVQLYRKRRNIFTEKLNSKKA